MAVRAWISVIWISLSPWLWAAQAQPDALQAILQQANTLQQQNQTEQALPLALAALQQALDHQQSSAIQQSRNVLVQLYLQLQAPAQALQQANAALTQAILDKDQQAQQRLLVQLSQASQLKQDWASAEDWLRQAIQLNLQLSDKDALSAHYDSLGQILLVRQRGSEAEVAWQQAWLLAEQLNDHGQAATVLAHWAELDVQRQQWSAAEEKWQRCWQLLSATEHDELRTTLAVNYLTQLVPQRPEQAIQLYPQLIGAQPPPSNLQGQQAYWRLKADVAQLQSDTQQAALAHAQLVKVQQQLWNTQVHQLNLINATELQKNQWLQNQLETQQSDQFDQLTLSHHQRLTLTIGVGAALAFALLLSLFYHKNKRNQLLLKQQQQLAQQKIAVKNEFIASLGHEIRSPLQGILAVTEQLSSELHTSSAQQKLKLIKRALGSLDNIITNILTSSRLEQGDYSLSLRPLALTELVSQLQDLLKPLAENKGLQFTSYVSPAVPALVLSDENLLNQLLTNLISNAVKYTEQGEIELRIEAVQQQLVFKVRDTGVGLTQLQISQLLRGERLAQQRPLQAGPGLGLLLCQKLLTQVDSLLKIQSVPKVGTEVSFQLELQAADPELALQPHLQQDWALVVEDDELCRLSLQQHLTELGFQVQVAVSLAQLAQLPAQTWGWLFLDGQLSDGNVEQVLQLLQQRQQFNALSRLVLVSGSAPLAPAPVFSAVLQKPWRRDQLQALIGQLARFEALQPLYDANYFRQSLDALNAEQRAKVLHNLLDQLQELSKELQEKTPDLRFVHRMAGSLGQLGLLRLGQLCRIAEQQLKEQPLEAELLLTLRQCLQQSRAWLQQQANAIQP